MRRSGVPFGLRGKALLCAPLFESSNRISLRRERRAWVPLITKISREEHLQYQVCIPIYYLAPRLTNPKDQILLKRCLDESLPTKVLQYIVETNQKDIERDMSGAGDEGGNYHLANLFHPLSEFYRLGIWVVIILYQKIISS